VTRRALKLNCPAIRHQINTYIQPIGALIVHNNHYIIMHQSNLLQIDTIQKSG
jgi:hypothetical protein